MNKDRRDYLIRFLRGCSDAADKNEIGIELGRLMINGDLMREAADEFEKLNEKEKSVKIVTVLDDWNKIGEQYLKTFNLTHFGITPNDLSGKSILWGLRYPDPHLLVFEDSYSSKPPIYIDRVKWERLTNWPPPWPWADDNLTLKIL